jgi:hypothetical protein
VIGEIDCREGILVAVEKDRYPTVQDGMKHTISIFITVLKKLITQKRIKVSHSNCRSASYMFLHVCMRM